MGTRASAYGGGSSISVGGLQERSQAARSDIAAGSHHTCCVIYTGKALILRAAFELITLLSCEHANLTHCHTL